MATAKRNPSRRSSGKRRFPWASAALVLFAAGAVSWYVFGEGLVGDASAATGYGAKTACSCRYIAGRELGSCKDDFVPGMEVVMLSEDEEARSVTASVPLLYSQTATYRDGFGCVLGEETE